jgi:hypothetical protein
MTDLCFTFDTGHDEEGPEETHALGLKLVRKMNERLSKRYHYDASYAEVCDEHGDSIEFQIIIEQDDESDREQAEDAARDVAEVVCDTRNFREYRER